MSGTELMEKPAAPAKLGRAIPPAFQGKQFPLLAVIVFLALFPPLIQSDAYDLGLLNNVLIYSLLTLGFYWCFALAGQFTFAVFGMYAVGAYVSVWAARHLGGFWSGLVAAVVVTAAIGALTKLAFARCSEIYFAIATMALGSLIVILFREWTSFTGGYEGVSDIAVPSIFGYQLISGQSKYYLGLGILAVLLLLTVLFFRSPVARDLAFARDKGPVAAVTGLKPVRLQLMGFAVGSGIQGAAGSLYAHGSGFFSVEAFNIDLSLLVLLMLLLGGMVSMYGAIIGAVILVYLPEFLRDASKYAEVIYALAILVIIVAFPRGIAGLRHTLGRLVRRA
ncbi:branched-chain amino acid ABC transporter permease [Actinoplanes sp. NPDC026619]|uniref:branched-chain amino acid ABC transporter permease n=1 Tax=Actinoplanes sp. NPDC026619 TaxID=3155798 RepID=UPI0033F79B21